MFFGKLVASINNPNEATKTSSKTSSKKSVSTVKKNNNIYNTKNKTVYLNTDSINGHSSDNRRLEEMKKLLKKEGWKVVNCGVGSEAHYQRRGEVKNGIWFCLYGGACAGTLKEHCTSS